MQGVPPAEALNRVEGKLVPLGQRFHGSDSSFPFSSYNISPAPAASDKSTMAEYIARLLVEFQLANTDAVPPGWVVRMLARCGIPYVEIWDVFHQMYESQVCDNPCFIEPNSHFSCEGSPVQLTIGCPDTLSRNLRAFPGLVRGGKALSWCIFPCRSHRLCRGTVSPRVGNRGCSEGHARGL